MTVLLALAQLLWGGVVAGTLGLVLWLLLALRE